MRDRLVQIMQAEGITSAKLAEMAGVQPAAVSHILSGRNKPGFDFLASIIRSLPALNARWLMLGEGEMYLQNDKTSSEPQTEKMNLPEKYTDNTGCRLNQIGFFYDNGTFAIYHELNKT